MDDVRDMVMGELVGFYSLAMEDAVSNLYSNWREEEARLSDLVCDGNDGFHRYPHAVVLSDEKPSQSLSDDLFSPPKRGSGAVALKSHASQTESEPEGRLNLANELEGCNSQSSMEPEENQSSPNRTQQTLEDELARLERVSSAESQGSKIDQGDVSLELRSTQNALKECQHLRKEADKEIKELRDDAKKLVDENSELKASARMLEQSIKEGGTIAGRMREDANGIPAIQARDEEEAETSRKGADNKIKDLEATLKQRTKELKKFQKRDIFMSQVSEQLKGQLSAVHHKLGKAEAKAAFACAREKLAREKLAQEAATADASSTTSSSPDDPGEHLQLVADLIDRVDKAESNQVASRRDLQEIQDMVSGLDEDTKHVRDERNSLALERDKLLKEKVELAQQKDALKEDLKAYMDSTDEVAGQNVRLLEQLQDIEQKMRKKVEEIKNKDEEIQKKNREIREKDFLLREKKEELKAKQKTLDECHEHGERLKKQVADLKNSQTGPSDDPRIATLKAEIARLEESVFGFRNKWSFAEERFKSEQKRRVILEEKGVEHLRNEIKGKLVSEDKELREDWIAEHNKIVEGLKKDIQALARRAEVGEAELERIKTSHQEEVDGLEFKIRDLESRKSAACDGADPMEPTAEHQKTLDELKLRVQELESRNPAADDNADLARIKDEHQKTVDALKLEIRNLEKGDHLKMLTLIDMEQKRLTEVAGLEKQVVSLTTEKEEITRVLSGMTLPRGNMTSHQGTQTCDTSPVEDSTRILDYQMPIDETLGTTSGNQHAPPELRAIHQQFLNTFESLIQMQSTTANKLDSFFKSLCDKLGNMDLPEDPNEYQVDRMIDLRNALHEARTKMQELALQKKHHAEVTFEHYPEGLYALTKKIDKYKKRLVMIENRTANGAADEDGVGNGAGGSGGENQPDQSGGSDWETASSDETSSGGDDDSDSDEDGPDPGNDPKKLRKAIDALESKKNIAESTLQEEGQLLRATIDHFGGVFNQIYQDIGNPCEPARQIQREIEAVAQAVGDLDDSEATVAGPSSAAGAQPNVADPPLPPDSTFNHLAKGLDKWRGKKKAYRFPDDGDPGSSGDSSVDGDIDRYSSPKRTAWEARVHAIREILTQTYAEQRACIFARNDIMEATRNLQVADDPIRQQPGPASSSLSAHPLPSAPADQEDPGSPQAEPSSTTTQPAIPDSPGDESRRAFQSHNAFDDLTTELSSQSSSDFVALHATDRILPSYLPRSIWDPLNEWSMSCENVYSNLERLDYLIESLIHDGVNSQNYEWLRSRARQLKILLEKANATVAVLQAREPDEFVGMSDNELVEEARRLKKENEEWEKKLKDYRKIAVGVQGEMRTRYFRANSHAMTLQTIKEKLEQKISAMEDDRQEAIDDGVDKQIRETVYYYGEQKKDIEKKTRRISELEGNLAEEQSSKSALFDETIEAIKDLQGEIHQLRKDNEKLEDRGKTLTTDMERALDITTDGSSGTDAQKLVRMRERISHALHLDLSAIDDYEVEEFPEQGMTEREEGLIDIINEQVRQWAKLYDQHKHRITQQKQNYDDRLAKRDISIKLQQSKMRDIMSSQRRRLGLCELELQAERMQLKHARARIALMEKQQQQQLRDHVDMMIDQDEKNLKAAGEGTFEEKPGRDGEGKGKQRAGAPGGGPGGDPGDDDDDDDDPGEGPNGDSCGRPASGPRGPGKKQTGNGKKCSCPCLGGCDSSDRSVASQQTTPAARQHVVSDLVKVYDQYKRCCGRKSNSETDKSNTTAAPESGTETVVPEDDGLLLVRLAGIMEMDSATRERIAHPRPSYLFRLLLAFWSCIRIHYVSWRQALHFALGGLVCLLVYPLPGSSWKPSRPAFPEPKPAALVIKDTIVLYWFYCLYQALTATWAVQRIYDMANGVTRAYFIERALHPERSRWWGIDGIDMRLAGFSATKPAVPFTTGEGAAV
ncbi:hypothetical protein SGCOL_000609 [Colletotrichum sp. CLE4]